MRFASAALCAAGMALWSASDAAADSPVVIEGASDDQREALEKLLPDRDPPETLFEAERISEEAAARAAAWYRAEGYYAAEVIAEAQGNPAVARLRIEPGTRFTYEAPSVTYVGAPPPEDAMRGVDEAIATMRPGDPARAETVLLSEGAALAALNGAGYPDADAENRRVIVDHATTTMRTEFRLEAGERVRLGQVRVEPPETFRNGWADRLQNWEDGATYTPEAMTQLRRDLTSTGAVSRASTRLEPTGMPGVRDVVLEVEPAERNAYELGLGYSTTEGVGVDAQWTRRNYTRRADALTVATTLSELQQRLSADLRRPHAAGLGHARHYTASISREDTVAFTRQGVAIGSAVEADPRLPVGVSYGVQASADRYDDVGGNVRDAYVLSGFGEWSRDTTRIELDPLQGSRITVRAEPSYALGDTDIAFLRTTADGRLYDSYGGDRYTLAARARFGWLESLTGDVNDIPPDRRFYAGGGGSVRGYEYNSIYPVERDALGLAPGGQGLAEFSVEARTRFAERWGAVAFLDGGSAFDSWEDAADFKWGVGVGARYNLGFAPLRFDIAVPLDPGPDDPDFALYISLGQAF